MKQNKPLYIRPSAVQAVFGISRSTLYRMAKEGTIKIYKRAPGSSASFVKVADLEACITGKDRTASGFGQG